MRLTRRGKIIFALAVVVALSGAVGALALTGHAPAPIQRAFSAITGKTPPPPPPTCPLTGTPAPGGKIPARPALAIKVENLPEARPQSGLDRADVVFEEPVEGGITRFIAVFQCHGSGRVGPVRSGRLEDPDILRQLGHPVMGFAGGARPVVRAVDRSPVIDENYLIAPDAYTRDASRPEPHNLYTSTAALYKAAKKPIAKAHAGPPRPIFTYGDQLPARGRPVGTAHLGFSAYSDVYWHWSGKEGVWLRSHGTVPHTLTDGSQVQATNVVVMSVRVRAGTIHDAAGNPSPVVQLTGSGKAWILRDGMMVAGRWQRASLHDITTFTTKAGATIALQPGTTWVELLPSTIAPRFAKS